MRYRRMLALALLGLTACAAEVVRRPTDLRALPDGASGGAVIEVSAEARLSVGPGYTRVIPLNSRWKMVGSTKEGDVYKPVDRVFTVEGAQVHEAYLVLDGDRVVGFYLPVERAFSPMADGAEARLSFQRREP